MTIHTSFIADSICYLDLALAACRFPAGWHLPKLRCLGSKLLLALNRRSLPRNDAGEPVDGSVSAHRRADLQDTVGNLLVAMTINFDNITTGIPLDRGT